MNAVCRGSLTATRFVFIALLSAVAASMAFANPPPGYYNRWRSDAGEALIIRATSVKADVHKGVAFVEVEATVLAVERSKSGLKTGATIKIIYEYSDPKVVKGTGPGTPPIHTKGHVYPAFLNKSSNEDERIIYYGAANRDTFVMIPEVVISE